MKTLTASQTRLLDFITTTIADRGYAPTIREMMKALNFTSTNSISELLVRLEAAGCIQRDSKKARALRLTGGAA